MNTKIAVAGFTDPIRKKRLEGELQNAFVGLHDTLMDARSDFLHLESVVSRVLYGEDAAPGLVSGLEV